MNVANKIRIGIHLSVIWAMIQKNKRASYYTHHIFLLRCETDTVQKMNETHTAHTNVWIIYAYQIRSAVFMVSLFFFARRTEKNKPIL